MACPAPFGPVQVAQRTVLVSGLTARLDRRAVLLALTAKHLCGQRGSAMRRTHLAFKAPGGGFVSTAQRRTYQEKEND